MPKKTDPPMSPEEQSRRFEEAARDIEAAGGLSPTEAEQRFEELLLRSGNRIRNPNERVDKAG